MSIMEAEEDPVDVDDSMMESMHHDDDDDDDVVVDDGMMMHHHNDDVPHIVMDFLDRPPTREEIVEVCSYEGIALFSTEISFKLR
jgi:hypothetical protein